MKMRKTSFVILLIVIFLLGGGFAFGAIKIIGGEVSITGDEYDRYKQLDDRYGKLDQLYDKVYANYYLEPNKDNLKTGMYKGLLAGLGDPYSGYMTKKEYESWMASTTGEFDGIGITFSSNKEGQLVVINVIAGTPADKGGMKAGDIILAVDGKVYTDMEAAGAAMRGKAGTKVKIAYERDGGQKEVTLERAQIINESVTSKTLENNIGYIKVSAFEEHTAEDFINKLSQFEDKKVKGLVIDLRQNGGGLVDSGVEIADKLLDKGTVTYLQDRQGNKKTYSSDEQKTNLPYVLLVDEGTASTSEILAAAIKDEGGKNIVGTKTFGKGIVQATETLEDGDAIKLTIMQYFSPKGNEINKTGIKPDYVVKPSNGSKDTQLDKAISLLK